jgi:hypothetical protein
MKLFFTVLIFFLNSALGLTQEAEFYLKEHTFKFPKTKEGEILEHTFVFENRGELPLIINDYAVACHCTKVEYSDKPIMPGQKGEVKIVFNSEGKYYHQDRFVFLHTNSKKKKEKLRFKVFVIPKDE